MMSNETNIYSIKLFTAQKIIKDKILNDNKKWNIIVSSRQAGKSTLLIQLISYFCINFDNLTNLYVTPTYSLAKIIFDKIVSGLQHTGCIKTASKSDLIITFVNGSKLYFKSATNAVSIRGMSVDYLFIDEAAYINSEDWRAAIRPTMNVRGKQCILVSTPRGKNFFYDIYNQSREDTINHNSFRLHYTDNPLYDIQEVNDARKTLPSDIFEQEYEGKFIEGGGSVFRNLDLISKINNFTKTGNEFYAGLDLGKQRDYTCLIIMNEEGDVVDIYRDNQKNWRVLINNIISKLKEYNADCIVEINGPGDPIYDDIKNQYENVKPFYTSNKSKQEIIEDLILAINDFKIKIPTKELFEQLYNELEYFTYDYSPKTRSITYSAPSGLNDDCVMSLAFANFARKEFVKNKVSFSFL